MSLDRCAYPQFRLRRGVSVMSLTAGVSAMTLAAGDLV
jgi:hypothetical protein